MDRERWERIQAVFDAACDLPDERRAAFLARECRGDPALRRQVTSLLAADERADAFLSHAIREITISLIRRRRGDRPRS